MKRKKATLIQTTGGETATTTNIRKSNGNRKKGNPPTTTPTEKGVPPGIANGGKYTALPPTQEYRVSGIETEKRNPIPTPTEKQTHHPQTSRDNILFTARVPTREDTKTPG